jgi:hypothetical protein
MTDIVERLRRYPAHYPADFGLVAHEAADEIERLRAERGQMTLTADHQKRGTEKFRERLMGGRKTAFIKWWDSLPREKIVSAGEGFDAGYAAAIAADEIEADDYKRKGG